MITLCFWGAGALAVYLSSYIVTLHLNPKEAGYFFLLQTIIVTVGMLSSLGLNSFMPKLIGESITPSGVSDKVRMVILIAFINGIVFSLIAILLINFLRIISVDLNLSIKICICIVSHSLLVILSSVFQSVRKANLSVLYLSIIQQALFCILFLIYFTSDYHAAINILLVSYLCSVAFCVTHLCLSTPSLFNQFFLNDISIKTFFSILKLVPHFLTIMLLSISINQMPLIISSRLMEISDVAAFQVAIKLSSLVAIVITAVNTIVAPIFASFNINCQYEELKKLYVKSTLFIITLTLPVIILFFIYSKFFMGLFGDIYEEHHSILEILLIGQLFNVITGPLACLFTMIGKYRVVINSNVLNVFFVFLGYILSSLFTAPTVFVFSISLGIAASNILMFFVFLRKVFFIKAAK